MCLLFDSGTCDESLVDARAKVVAHAQQEAGVFRGTVEMIYISWRVITVVAMKIKG